MYHSGFTTSDLYLDAEHVLEVIAHMFTAIPPESVVESMGSVLEKSFEACSGSKTAMSTMVWVFTVVHRSIPHTDSLSLFQ